MAAIDDVHSGRGFRRKQRLDAYFSRSLGHLPRVIASRYGSHDDRVSHDCRQPFRALFPLRDEPLPRLARHARWVGTGVTPDYVPALVQRPDLFRSEKAWPANPIGSHKKVPAPAVLFQHSGDRVIGARSAIVESKQHFLAPGRLDRRKLPRKILPVELINGGAFARKTAGCVIAVFDYVVV